MEELVYIYDGTFEGILSCVFDAYYYKDNPQEVSIERGLQLTFGQQVRHVETDYSKANRVGAGLRKKAGDYAFEMALTGFYSGRETKGTCVFQYILLGFTVGYKIKNMLTHPHVLALYDLNQKTAREVHFLYGFVRFSLMENDVFFSRITPKNKVIPLLMTHFADRYQTQAFVIYDDVHHMAGIYDMQKWEIVETEGLSLPPMAEGEEKWTTLWRNFCEAITIKERVNLSLQRSMCPKRYWGNMLEMQPSIPQLEGTINKKGESTRLLP